MAKKRATNAPKKAGTRTPSPPSRRELGLLAGATVAMQLAVWGVLWGAFGALRLGYRFFDMSDIVDPYLQYALNLANGSMAYRDFFIEYPPLFVPLLYLGGNVLPADNYVIQFAAMMGVFMVAAGVLSAIAAADGTDAKRPYFVAAAFAVLTLLLGPISVNRYDATVAFVVAVTLLFFMRKRWTAAGIAIGIGFALKITPVILLPIVLLLAPRRDAIKSLIGFGVAAAIPFLAVMSLGGRATSALWQMLSYHLSRPLEIESVLATPFWIARLGGMQLKIGLGAGSQVIESGVANAIASASSVVLLLALGATIALIWRRRGAILAEPRLIALASLTLVLGSLVGSKVLSPQYLVWIVPAVALVAIDRKLLGVLVGAALALTQLLFPANYYALSDHQLIGPTLIIIARNLLIVAGFGLSLSYLWKLPEAPAERRR